MNFLLILFPVFFVLLNIQFGYSQLIGGDIVNEGRKIAQPFDFVINENVEGVLFYRIAVNREGKITSAQLIENKSTNISTPVKVRAKSKILQLTFESGTHYPKFHSGEVRLNVVKIEN